MRHLACGVLALATACAFAAVDAIAQGEGSGSQLTVEGAVRQRIALTMNDLAAMPRRTVQVADSHTGKTDTYEGVPLTDILARAGVPQGREMRGSGMVMVVVAEAWDGYRAAFSLAELDAGIGDAQVLVADRVNGNLLDSKQGPLKLVVPRDKRPARSVRNLKIVRVLSPSA